MIGYIYLTINDINNTCYIGKRQKPANVAKGKEKAHTVIFGCLRR